MRARLCLKAGFTPSEWASERHLRSSVRLQLAADFLTSIALTPADVQEHTDEMRSPREESEAPTLYPLNLSAAPPPSVYLPTLADEPRQAPEKQRQLVDLRLATGDGFSSSDALTRPTGSSERQALSEEHDVVVSSRPEMGDARQVLVAPPGPLASSSVPGAATSVASGPAGESAAAPSAGFSSSMEDAAAAVAASTGAEPGSLLTAIAPSTASAVPAVLAASAGGAFAIIEGGGPKHAAASDAAELSGMSASMPSDARVGDALGEGARPVAMIRCGRPRCDACCCCAVVSRGGAARPASSRSSVISKSSSTAPLRSR
jgi:hypothetical protein